MAVAVTVRTVRAIPTAVVAAAATWAQFPKMWRPMLDEVWEFLLTDAAEGIYARGHNIMLYKDDVPNVEVGVQVTSSFPPAGHVVASMLPGGLAAIATHTVGDRHDRRHPSGCLRVDQGARVQAGRARWEIYGDPDPSTSDFDVDVFWSLVAP